MIVSTPREALWAWVNSRVGIPWSEDFRAIGVVRDDCLLAAAAYNAFVGRVCFMHGAIDDPSAISRTFLHAIFDYPFNVCGMTTVIMPIPSSNTAAVAFAEKCGFKEDRRFVGAGLEGDDLVFFSLTRNDCRWINYGKEKPSSRT